MQLDFKRAILLPFSGKDWHLKLIVLSILSMFRTDCHSRNIYFIIIILIVFLPTLFWGYFSQFAHNVFNNISSELPSWKLDIRKYLYQGLICLSGILIYVIILYYTIWPFDILTEKFNNIYLKYLYEIRTQLVVVFATFVIPCLYAERFNFKDIFDLKKQIITISNAKLEFLLCFGVFIISNKTILLISTHLKPIYLQIILTSVMFAIVFVIVFDLFIQTFEISKKKYIGSKTLASNTLENLEIEKELSKWNWGAFFSNCIWGLFNKSYWTLLVLIPYFGSIWAFVCGLKGNEWAWKNTKWESIEQFKKVQKRWAIASVVFWGIISAILIIAFLIKKYKII